MFENPEPYKIQDLKNAQILLKKKNQCTNVCR